MMTAIHRLYLGITSLRLTLLCLAAALVLVFAGTLAQVRLGLYFVQEHYFQSWFIWWSASSDSFKIPVFPGGHLIGAVLLLNLVASQIRRLSFTWRKLGTQLIHLGLIIMLAGGLATDLFSVSSYMRIKEGESKNYSEDSMRVELAVIDLTDPASDQVTAVPGEVLADGGTITDKSLPFEIVVQGFYRNSELRMIGESGSSAVAAAGKGAGAGVSYGSEDLGAARLAELGDVDSVRVQPNASGSPKPSKARPILTVAGGGGLGRRVRVMGSRRR